MSGLIYLFRHGQSLAPPGLMVGQSDFELSAAGLREAGFWRDRLAAKRFTWAVSSPLTRARQTAELILAGRPDNAPLQLLDDLKEISLGDWEGHSKPWIREHYPAEWAARGRDMINVAPPGGESLAQLTGRIGPVFHFLTGIATHHENILVVTHQAVIRVLLTSLPGSWPAKPLDLAVTTAGLAVLAADEGGRLRCLKRVEADSSVSQDGPI